MQPFPRGPGFSATKQWSLSPCTHRGKRLLIMGLPGRGVRRWRLAIRTSHTAATPDLAFLSGRAVTEPQVFDGRARRRGIHSAQRTARPAAPAVLDLELAEHGVRHDLRRRSRGRGIRSRFLGGGARRRPRQRDRRSYPGDPVPARPEVRGAADGAEPAGVRLLGQRAARRAELGHRRDRLVRGEQRQRRPRAERADPPAAGALPAHHRGGAGRGGVLRLQPGAPVRAVRLPHALRHLPDRVRRHPEQGPSGRLPPHDSRRVPADVRRLVRLRGGLEPVRVGLHPVLQAGHEQDRHRLVVRDRAVPVLRVLEIVGAAVGTVVSPDKALEPARPAA